MKKYATSFNLKIIAILFMVIDHVYSYLGSFIGLPRWTSLLGRFIAPLFVFFLVEGFLYTRSH
ncbi:TraX family protein [Enterococcus lemanii]|uniref:TraX family protein n=1 Tax=Enterococcus lemanii TaxID=1159752 RepID=A0ABV9MSV5_9ENTE|nr:TraX family protein [Enterococcus lemanii]MBM7710262.1 putative membrane protein [Enterococcus lemanii]